MKSVIIIDDDLDAVNVLNDLCEIYKIPVLAKGYDGKEAIELYKQYKPDVVFLDIFMPKYDGFYALEGIRNIDPQAKIIVITASVDDIVDARLDKLKPSAFIRKPYDFKEIIDIINKL